MAVELRPVHAGKIGLPPHRDAASAAHPRSIDHDGIQADQRWNVVFLGHHGHKLHHGHRPDGHRLVYFFLFQVLYFLRNLVLHFLAVREKNLHFFDQDRMVHEISVFEELDDAVHDPVYFHQDNGVKVLQHRAQTVI